MTAIREIMAKTISNQFFVIATTVFLAGCTTSNFLSGQNIAAVSIAPDEVVSSGSLENDTGSTITSGSLSGGIIGKGIGSGIDETDRRKALIAEYEALEYSPAGSETVWRNEATGNRGVVVPAATYDVGNRNCRQYVHTVYVDEKPRTAQGTACKEQDGMWQLVS